MTRGPAHDEYGFRPLDQTTSDGELGSALAVIESLLLALEGQDGGDMRWRVDRARAFLARHPETPATGP